MRQTNYKAKEETNTDIENRKLKKQNKYSSQNRTDTWIGLK